MLFWKKMTFIDYHKKIIVFDKIKTKQYTDKSEVVDWSLYSTHPSILKDFSRETVKICCFYSYMNICNEFAGQSE